MATLIRLTFESLIANSSERTFALINEVQLKYPQLNMAALITDVSYFFFASKASVETNSDNHSRILTYQGANLMRAYLNTEYWEKSSASENHFSLAYKIAALREMDILAFNVNMADMLAALFKTRGIIMNVAKRLYEAHSFVALAEALKAHFSIAENEAYVINYLPVL